MGARECVSVCTCACVYVSGGDTDFLFTALVASAGTLRAISRPYTVGIYFAFLLLEELDFRRLSLPFLSSSFYRRRLCVVYRAVISANL